MDPLNMIATAVASVLALAGAGHGTSPISPPQPGTNTSCIATAVAAREASIDSAIETYASTITQIYAIRASDLATAYAKTDNASIKAGVKVAWTSFNTSAKKMRTELKSARESAGKTFQAAVKACGTTPGTPTPTTDTANVTADTTGGI
jgi:hypothetical protein